MTSLESDDNDEDDFLDDDISSLKESDSKILSKFGYDLRSLISETVKKSENGTAIRFKPPLIASLFHNVPPKINFITHDDKSIITNF